MRRVVRADKKAEHHRINQPLDHLVPDTLSHGGSILLTPACRHANEPHDGARSADGQPMGYPHLAGDIAQDARDHIEKKHAALAENLLHHRTHLHQGEKVKGDVHETRM